MKKVPDSDTQPTGIQLLRNSHRYIVIFIGIPADILVRDTVQMTIWRKVFNKMLYRIRAHHGMCFSFFQGKGYSGDFIENMQAMKETLSRNPEVVLLCETDDVCSRCPNNHFGQCAGSSPETPGKAESYDRQVLALCGLREGTKIRWEDFADAVQTHILSPGKRREICGDCEWDSLCR
mgnify:CR=1 FL=1